MLNEKIIENAGYAFDAYFHITEVYLRNTTHSNKLVTNDIDTFYSLEHYFYNQFIGFLRNDDCSVAWVSPQYRFTENVSERCFERFIKECIGFLNEYFDNAKKAISEIKKKVESSYLISIMINTPFLSGELFYDKEIWCFKPAIIYIDISLKAVGLYKTNANIGKMIEIITDFHDDIETEDFLEGLTYIDIYYKYRQNPVLKYLIDPKFEKWLATEKKES